MPVYQAAYAQVKKGELVPLYLVCGEEAYLREKFLAVLTRAFLGEEEAFGREKVAGEEASLAELLQRLRETNLFSPRRLLVVDNPPYLASRGKQRDRDDEQEPAEEDRSTGKEEVPLDALESFRREQCGLPAPQKILVFVAPQVDRRKSLYRYLSGKATVVDCAPLQGDALRRWVVEQARKFSKKIDRQAVELLLLSAGNDLWFLHNELAKFATYLEDGDASSQTITARVVELLGSGDQQGNVFKMVDALAEGRLEQAFRLLEQLLARREAPLLLLAMITRHYRLLVGALSLQKAGVPQGKMSAELKVPPFVARKLQQQVAAYSMAALLEALLLLQEADQAIKTGKMEPRLALETLLARLHALNAASR